MHLQVYKEPLCRRYYASPCSLATVYWIGSMVTLLLAPFMMAYDPYKFWSKTDTYLEQPEVTYTKQLLLQAEGFKSDEAHFSLFSTVAGINDFSHVRLHGMAVKSFATNTNTDGLDDRLVLNVRLPLESDEEIYSIKMLVFFRTRLRDRARLEMDNLVYFEAGGCLPGGSLFVEGDLSLRQTWPLSVYGGYSYPYRDYPLLNPATLTSARETLFSLLLARNAARNLTLDFEPQYSLWERAPPHAIFESGRFLNITAVFRIHQQPILYIPPVSEVLRAGWSKVVETKMVGPYVGIGAAGHTLAAFSR